MSFGQRVKKIKKHNRLSELELQEICGVSSTSLTAYYNEKSEPKLGVVSKLLKKFPVLNARWLLIGEGEMLISNKLDIANESQPEYGNRIVELEKENSRLKDELLKAKDEVIAALQKK